VNEVIWHVTMSLDGFITGPDDAMEWAFRYPGSPLGDDVMNQTGAILAGRRWYDVATSRYSGTEGIYGGAWTGPVLVLTHRPPASSSDSTVTFLSDGIEDAVATARAAAAPKRLEIFGARTAQQALQANLVDEIVIHLAPVLLGGGVRLYDGPGLRSIELEREAVAEAGPLTDLRFRVKR
jgi:dihydrofolate reductase